MTRPPVPGPGQVLALFLGGGQEGPPVAVTALPDGSPPPQVVFEDQWATTVPRGPRARPALAVPAQVYVLAPQQPIVGLPAAPYRYFFTGFRPRFGPPT